MIRLLRSYGKGYERATIGAPFAKVLEALFELMIPLVVKQIIDYGIPNHDTAEIMRQCGRMAALYGVGFLCTLLAQYLAARAAAGFNKNLQAALFRHAQTLSFTSLDQIGASALIARMTSDAQQLQTGLNLTLRLFSRSPVIVFGAVLMAFRIDVDAAWVFVVTIPLLAAVVFTLMGWSISRYRTMRSRLDSVWLQTRETIEGARVIRAFNNETREIEAFHRSNAALSEATNRAGRLSALMNPLTFLILNLAITVLIYTGAIRVNIGALSQGSVVALYNYMSQILVELIKLANLIVTISKSIACAKRIQAVLAIEPDRNGAYSQPSDPLPLDAAAVEFDHVNLRYAHAGADALTDITLSVARGETIGIIGGTGAGKSSLIRLIAGFYPATSGEVRVEGIDVQAWDRNALRARIGFVLQQTVLFRGTIRDNLRWGRPDATDDEMLRALDVAKAREFVEEKPGGLDFAIEEGGKNLSGGQRQRLAIARAIVRNPDLLILDDSASALDYRTDAALRQAIRALRGDMTVFIVAQRVASVRNADRIVVLEEGHIAGIGTHETLLSTNETYWEIYDSQFPGEAKRP